MTDEPMTVLSYLRDAFTTEFTATVVGTRDGAIALDHTFFYPTGGGQPHDTGTLAGLAVVDVRKEGGLVWHRVADGSVLPAVGAEVEGRLDWERRHQLMRTHTALHILCGVIWNEWHVPVTGGNMEPLAARMDFEFEDRFRDLMKLKPSEYWQRQCKATFQYDVIGPKLLNTNNLMTEDTLMWGSDYPHTDGIWPESSKYIDEQFAGLSAEQIRKITCDNAAKFYNLTN